MRCKSVAVAAIVCITIAVGAMRIDKHGLSATIKRVNNDAAHYTAKGDDSLLSRARGKVELNDPPSAPPAAHDQETNSKTAAVLLEEKAIERAQTARVSKHKESTGGQEKLEQIRKSGRLPETLQQRGPPEEERKSRRTSVKAASSKMRAKTEVYGDKLKANRRASAEAARAAERVAEQAADACSDNLQRMGVEDLQECCRSANLSDVGTKAVLVDTLQANTGKRKRRVASSDDAGESSLRDGIQAEPDRSLRGEQDQDFIQALEFGTLREELERIEEAESVAKRPRPAREVQFAKLEAEEAEGQTLEERRRGHASQLPPPGPDATETIALKLPTGPRIVRKLSPGAKLADVYAWADCLAHLPENEGKGLVIPQRFMLKANYPSRDLTEMDASIQELQLGGAVVLLVEIEEDE